MLNKSSHATLAARLAAMLVLAFCSTMSVWAQSTTAVDISDAIVYLKLMIRFNSYTQPGDDLQQFYKNSEFVEVYAYNDGWKKLKMDTD